VRAVLNSEQFIVLVFVCLLRYAQARLLCVSVCVSVYVLLSFDLKRYVLAYSLDTYKFEDLQFEKTRGLGSHSVWESPLWHCPI